MNTSTLITNFQTLSTEETKNIKGGLRYITRSQSKFEAKRNYLQSCGEQLDIKHQYGVYCIEW